MLITLYWHNLFISLDDKMVFYTKIYHLGNRRETELNG